MDNSCGNSLDYITLEDRSQGTALEGRENGTKKLRILIAFKISVLSPLFVVLKGR